QAVDMLDRAWKHDDRAGAKAVAPDDVIRQLFAVPAKGWTKPKCKSGECKLKKSGVPGPIKWAVQGGSTGYFVNVVEIPPIPLSVKEAKGRPAWALYLAVGPSG